MPARLPSLMAITDPVEINDHLSIPLAELPMRATRSSGPGGQHVNTSSTRIELTWDIAASAVLTEDQRGLLLERLASRLTGEGVLRIVSQGERSQLQNREAAIRRLRDLVRRALTVQRKRRATRPTRASKERRLVEKKKRGEIKRLRRDPGSDE